MGQWTRMENSNEVFLRVTNHTGQAEKNLLGPAGMPAGPSRFFSACPVWFVTRRSFTSAQSFPCRFFFSACLVWVVTRRNTSLLLNYIFYDRKPLPEQQTRGEIPVHGDRRRQDISKKPLAKLWKKTKLYKPCIHCSFSPLDKLCSWLTIHSKTIQFGILDTISPSVVCQIAESSRLQEWKQNHKLVSCATIKLF